MVEASEAPAGFDQSPDVATKTGCSAYLLQSVPAVNNATCLGLLKPNLDIISVMSFQGVGKPVPQLPGFQSPSILVAVWSKGKAKQLSGLLEDSVVYLFGGVL